MLDAAAYPLRPKAAPRLPVAQMVIGQDVEAAAALLPRLFNLCRMAQGIAARAAFGLDPAPGWEDDLRAEIIREHVAKLCLKWPGQMSLPSVAVPRGWQTDPSALRAAVFGPAGQVPGDLDRWIAAGQGAAPVFGALSGLFALGDGTRAALPLTTPDSMFDGALQENSVAARHADHPLMQQIEALYGRGPLWSAMAVLIDLDALVSGQLPAPRFTPGQAVVPAARGLYAVRATVTEGVVTAFERITPTDHLLAPEGALAQALGNLPPARAAAIAPVMLSIMDPCFPVTLEAANA